MSKSSPVLETLKELNIPYQALEHEPLLTMQDGLEVERKLMLTPCKNLLLKNRQHEYFLLMVYGDKKVKMNSIAKQINSSHLSFADDSELKELLNVTTGAVSPLDLVADTQRKVKVLIDSEQLSHEFIGCHPGVNTMTVKIKTSDLTEVFFKRLNIAFLTVDCSL